MIIRGGVVLTMNANDDVVLADVRVTGRRVDEVGPGLPPDGSEEIDARGCVVMPGLVQTHMHLGQTLMRGVGENLDLVRWLDRWIWPLEQSLDDAVMEASVRAGTAELLLSGTTSFLAMEPTGAAALALECAAELGARATIGTTLADRAVPGAGTPVTDASAEISALRDLIGTWHRADAGRLRVAISPRTPSAVSPELWRRVAELSETHELIVNTAVNEDRAQSDRVERSNGLRDVQYLQSMGVLGPRTVLAHCVWLSPDEARIVAETRATVAHCPTTNLKLGSGVADVPSLLDAGVNVTLGTCGAASSGTLDAFREMRAAALLHRARYGAGAITPRQALQMMITNGAHALGDEYDLGRVEPACRADLVIVEAPDVAVPGGESFVAQRLVHSTTAGDVRDVLVDGRVVVRERELTRGTLMAPNGLGTDVAREQVRRTERQLARR